MNRRVWWSAGVALALGFAFVAGCASRREVVNLREPGDLPGAHEPLPESPAVMGHLSRDSLTLYRFEDGGWSARYSRAVGGGGVPIGGYTLADGRHVRFDGHVQLLGDSLAFRRQLRARGMEAPIGPDAFVLPLDQVRSVDVLLPDAGRTVMAVVILTLFVTTGVLLAAAASLNESLL